MRCPRCGRVSRPGARFCEGCGAALYIPRPRCGRVIRLEEYAHITSATPHFPTESSPKSKFKTSKPLATLQDIVYNNIV
ncbi:MAG: double zinc ribbon domain-containing protein [Anaerolineae bacterium]